MINLDILFGFLLTMLYLVIVYNTFIWLMERMKKKSSDYVIQIFPGWIMVMIISILFIYLYPFGKPILIYFMLYISIGTCFFLFILLTFVKNISLKKYNQIVFKLKDDRNIE